MNISKVANTESLASQKFNALRYYCVNKIWVALKGQVHYDGKDMVGISLNLHHSMYVLMYCFILGNILTN